MWNSLIVMPRISTWALINFLGFKVRDCSKVCACSRGHLYNYFDFTSDAKVLCIGFSVHISIHEYFLQHKSRSQWYINSTEHYYTQMYSIYSFDFVKLKFSPISEVERVNAYSRGGRFLIILCLGWALIRGSTYSRGRLTEALWYMHST